MNLQHEGIAIFNHNCCHGTDVINGSIVLNERCEIIGINIEYLTGWITALYFSTIRNELAEIFSDAENKVHVLQLCFIFLTPLVRPSFYMYSFEKGYRAAHLSTKMVFVGLIILLSV